MAKVIILGNLGKDVVVKNLENERVVLNFSVAENVAKKNKEGIWENIPQWFNCSMFTGANDKRIKHLVKGAKVQVLGELTIDEFKNQTNDMIKVFNVTTLSLNLLSFVEEEQIANHPAPAAPELPELPESDPFS